MLYDAFSTGVSMCVIHVGGQKLGQMYVHGWHRKITLLEIKNIFYLRGFSRYIENLTSQVHSLWCTLKWWWLLSMIIFLCFERIFIVISGYIMVFETGSKTYSHFLYNCTLPSLYRNIKKTPFTSWFI